MDRSLLMVAKIEEKENTKGTEKQFKIYLLYKTTEMVLVTPYKRSCSCGLTLQFVGGNKDEFDELRAYGLVNLLADLEKDYPVLDNHF